MTTVGTAAPTRLPQLTASRLLGALLVLAFHAHVCFALYLPGDSRAVPRLLLPALSSPAVSYFFVLTGFVITWSYVDRGVVARDLYRARFARFVPTNALWWAIGIAVILWYGGTVTGLGSVLSFLMLQSWVFDDKVVLTANPAAWSLSVDVLFYAIFPLLLPALLRVSRRGRWVLAGLLVLAEVQIAGLSDLHHQAGYLYQVAYFPLSRLPEFLLGALAALELRAGRLPRVPMGVALVGAAASLVLTRVAVAQQHPAFEYTVLCSVPSVLLIVALAQSDLDGRRSWLSHPRLVAAGNWTFALYLVQVPVLRAVYKLGGFPREASQQYLLALVGCLLCVVIAWAQYTWFEHPLERLIRGRGKRPDPVPAIAP